MQFELEPKESYFGTYVDDIVTGSFLLGTRGLAGSVVSGNLEWQGETRFSDWYYKQLFPWYRSGNTRGVKLFDTKKIYDSLVPDFTQITAINGAHFIAPKFDDYLTSIEPAILPEPFETKILKLIINFSGSLPITASNGIKLSDAWWNSSFPYQSRYKDVPRLTSLNKAIATNDYEEWADLPNNRLLYKPVTDLTSSNVYSLALALGNSNQPGWALINSYDKRLTKIFGISVPTATLGLGEKTFLTGYFGFDLVASSLFIATISGINPFDTGVFINVYYYYYILGGLSCRGWKYGLYNAFPTPASCIFRIGHYGQFRDMLEQRIFTKDIDLKTNSITSPFNIQFISGTEAYVTASSPSLNVLELGCYNQDFSSGLPYFD